MSETRHDPRRRRPAAEPPPARGRAGAPRLPRRRRPARAGRRSSASRRSRSTSCCSTSSCRRWTATRSAARCAPTDATQLPAGGDDHRERRAGEARGHRGGRRRLRRQAVRPGRAAGARALAAADQALPRHDRARRPRELAEWNRKLEQRVATQVDELERLGRLRRFLSPQLAELVLCSGDESFLESHRREITRRVLRPRAASRLRRDRRAGGRDGRAQRSTTRRSATSSTASRARSSASPATALMVFFNDPLPCPDAPQRAVRMAVAMRGRVAAARRGLAALRPRPGTSASASPWATRRSGGSASRAARTTRRSAASRTSPRGSARGAAPGQILISQRVHAAVGGLVVAEPVGELDAARLLAAGAGLQRARARRGDGRGHDRPRRRARRGSASWASASARRASTACSSASSRVWRAMRLNQPGESIVVVPSVTPDAAQPGAPSRPTRSACSSCCCSCASRGCS